MISKSFISFFLVLISMFSLMSKTYADSYLDNTEEADILYKNQHYEKAFRAYFILSRNTNKRYANIISFNQYRLAYMYKNGQGTDINLIKAIEWYKISADNDNYSSMNALGDIYFYGNDIIKTNYEKAYEYYLKAINEIYSRQGNINIRAVMRYDNIGWMRLYGKGVSKNIEFAYSFFEDSVQYKKDGFSYYMLGYICENGLHPKRKKDLNLALEYYNEAVNKGYMIAEKALENLMKSME